jgi:hypothetical protein
MATCGWMFTSPGAHLAGAFRSLVDGNAEHCVLLQEVDDVFGDFGWGPVSPLLLTDEGTGERPEHLWLGFYATSPGAGPHSRGGRRPPRAPQR